MYRIFLILFCCFSLSLQGEKILSLDGGGVRGVLTLEVLRELSTQARVDFHKDFDLFAGTSTGSIIAVCLASGMSIDEILRDYKTMSSEVFSHHHILHIFCSKYSQEQLKKSMLTILKERGFHENSTLSELPKKVVITTTKLSDDKSGSWTTEILENISEKGKTIKILDALLESTAAPTYFPSVNGYVDGGVALKDPSLAALMQVYNAETSHLKDYTIFSLGTGYEKHELTRDEDWGIAEWFTNGETGGSIPLLDLLSDVNNQRAQQACQTFLGKNYLKFDIPLTHTFPLDDYAQIDDLILFTQNYLKSNQKGWGETCEWLKTHIRDVL